MYLFNTWFIQWTFALNFVVFYRAVVLDPSDCYSLLFHPLDLNFPALTTPVGWLVTPTDRPKSVRNHCVIEVFGGVCVLSFGFRSFCSCRGFCHRTGSDLLFFSFPTARRSKAFTSGCHYIFNISHDKISCARTTFLWPYTIRFRWLLTPWLHQEEYFQISKATDYKEGKP